MELCLSLAQRFAEERPAVELELDYLQAALIYK
jgi:hypothetical protein